MALAGLAIATSAVQAQGPIAPTLEHKATLALTLAGQGSEIDKTTGTAPGTITETFQAAIETSKLSNKELLLLLDQNHVLPPGGISGWTISIISRDGELQDAFITKKGVASINISDVLDVSAEDSLGAYSGKTVTKFSPSSSTTTESYSFKGLASISTDELDGYNFETEGLYIGNGTFANGFDTLGAFSFSSILGVLHGSEPEQDISDDGFDNSDLDDGGDSIIEGWIKATSGKPISVSL